MNFLPKYLLFLLVSISSAKMGFAQDSSQAETTGEVVMTKAQLQSFLSTIAKLKKQHMAQRDSASRRQMELKHERFKNRYASGDAPTRNNFSAPELRDYRNQKFSNSMRQYNPSDERLFTQLELINARLHSVMSEVELLKIKAALNDPAASSSQTLPRYNQQQPQIRLEPKLQPVIINQGSPSQPYLNPMPQQNPPNILKDNSRKQSLAQPQADSILLARQSEQLALRNRINSLENETSLIQDLLKGSNENEKNKYNEEISNLNAQIDALNSQLAQNNKEADSLQLKKQNNLSNILNDFSYNIYFENNSALIPSSDYSKLQEIVNIAKQHPQAPVVLRGFASKSGNPQYNDKLSFQRAASIKKWLLDNGLDLKDIITMHHGVDKSVDASRARRVEITFKVQ